MTNTINTMTLHSLENLYQHLDGYDTIHQITDSILQTSLEQIESIYYRNRVSDYVAKWGEGQIMQVVKTIFQKTDPGEGDVSLFAVDPLVQPMKSDSLARQSVPVQIRPPPIEASESNVEQKPQSPTRSRRLNSSHSKTRNVPEDEATPRPQKQTAKNKSSTKTTRSKSSIPVSQKKPTADDDRNEELKRLERLKFQLRGKDYTYDHNGEIIVVNQLNVHKLPMHQVSLDVQISSTETTDNPSSKPLAKKKLIRHANKEADAVTSLAVSQPMVAAIVPAKGVTFKNGKKVIRGEPMVDDPSETLKSRRHQNSAGYNPSLLPLDGILKPPKKVNPSAKVIIDQIDSYQEVDENGEELDASNDRMPKDTFSPQDEDIEPAPAQNPAKLPPKNLRVVRATPGHLPYTTRTRKNFIPTKNRQRLPPPLYPASRGHGMMTSYLSQDNPFVQQYQSYMQSFQMHDEHEGTIQSHIFEEEYLDTE